MPGGDDKNRIPSQNSRVRGVDEVYVRWLQPALLAEHRQILVTFRALMFAGLFLLLAGREDLLTVVSLDIFLVTVSKHAVAVAVAVAVADRAPSKGQ